MSARRYLLRTMYRLDYGTQLRHHANELMAQLMQNGVLGLRHCQADWVAVYARIGAR